MKVGILTYNTAYNYGALLQSYALQKKINMLGHNCNVINYQCEGVINQYAFQKKINLLALKRNISWLLSIGKRKKMDKFRELLPLTKPIFKENIKDLNDVFDCFIVGSDQVWNKICTNGDEAFFLNFVENNIKKNSYAASFGRSVIDDIDKNKYQKLLNSFNYISVREESGIDIVRELTGKEIVCVLDPVFLITYKDWMKFVYSIKHKYIFVYQLVSDLNTIRYASRIAKQLGYELYIYTSNLHAGRYGKRVINMGVEDFLSFIANAELVITDSFHCSAFSVIFNTQFYSKFRTNDPANTRLENLLKIFGINSNVLEENYLNAINMIDFEIVNKILFEEQKKSENYLKLILTNK